jgi:HEPN domain-containing protein
VSSKPGAGQLVEYLDEIDTRLRDELSLATVLVLDEKSKDLFEAKEPLFGDEVEKKFSQMSEDIAEAGKCLALTRSTAAVFHLMRIMELAVQRFGDKLGVSLASEKNWQNILDEINKAIKTLDQKATQTKAYAEASAHLYNVKLCWRNEVMHPKQTYTQDEAKDAFNAVRAFIRDLAGIL